MALSQEVLNEIAGLDGPLAQVQHAVERVVAAQRTGAETLTKEEALSALERATDTWLDASGEVESDLLRYLPSGEPGQADDLSEDEADAVERLGGLSLIHLAVASDLAKLVPIDALNDGDLVGTVEPSPEPVSPSAIQAVTGDGAAEGQIRRAIALPTEQLDAEDGDAEEDDGVPQGPKGHVYPDNVLKKLVDRAGAGVRSVLVGTASSHQVVFIAVKPALDAALGLPPEAVAQAAKKTVRSIARLAKLVIHRAYNVVNEVTRGYAGMVKQFIDYAQPQELILTRTVRAVVAKMLSEREIHYAIQHRRTLWKQNDLKRMGSKLPVIPEPDDTARLRKILKHNKRWVGRPVPIAARFLHPLWAVPVGPVPAAPIAACVLLAWTVLFTGDQLDSPGPFPNFWSPGVMNLN